MTEPEKPPTDQELEAYIRGNPKDRKGIILEHFKVSKGLTTNVERRIKDIRANLAREGLITGGGKEAYIAKMAANGNRPPKVSTGPMPDQPKAPQPDQPKAPQPEPVPTSPDYSFNGLLTLLADLEKLANNHGFPSVDALLNYLASVSPETNAR
jgi:hypothetical protein